MQSDQTGVSADVAIGLGLEFSLYLHFQKQLKVLFLRSGKKKALYYLAEACDWCIQNDTASVAVLGLQ